MSDGKKQGDENWRDVTAKDVERVMAGETVEARFRDLESVKWVENGCSLAGWCAGVWTSSSGLSWVFCQVYREPTPTRSPKDGCRMSDEKKQGEENWRDATPDDVFKVLQGQTARARFKEEANENWVSTDVDGYDLHIAGWHRDKFIDSEGSHWSLCQVYVESGPPSSIGLTYDPWTDTVSKIVRTDASGKVVESISAPWKPLVGEEVRFVKLGHSRCGCVGIMAEADSIPQDGSGTRYRFLSLKRDFERWCVLSELEKYEPELKQHRTPTLADLRGGAITCEVRQGSGDNWEKKLLIHIFPVYGFPFVTASQGSIHRWAYCRIEVPVGKSDRPVPKGFRMLGDEPRLASDGYWSLSCKDWLVIGDRVQEANRDKWPAIRLVVDEPEPVKQQFVLGLDQASSFGSDPIEGSNPIEVRPIMQIRLPVPASVLGKLGDMLEKHYPGSTMRQAGGYLVFEEPIES